MTLREVGENLGLTRERVRQLENQALQKLMQGLARSGPCEPRRLNGSRKDTRTRRPPGFARRLRLPCEIRSAMLIRKPISEIETVTDVVTRMFFGGFVRLHVLYHAAKGADLRRGDDGGAGPPRLRGRLRARSTRCFISSKRRDT